MDAAMHRFPEKRVLGLLMVEGDENTDPHAPSTHWHRESEAAYSATMLEGSLPHRTADERNTISGNMLGVTTWQAACRALNVAWASLPDVI